MMSGAAYSKLKIKAIAAVCRCELEQAESHAKAFGVEELEVSCNFIFGYYRRPFRA
jgi:hypothetical protein